MRTKLLLVKRCSGTSLAEKEAGMRVKEGGPRVGGGEQGGEITLSGRIRDKYLEARQIAS